MPPAKRSRLHDDQEPETTEAGCSQQRTKERDTDVQPGLESTLEVEDKVGLEGEQSVLSSSSGEAASQSTCAETSAVEGVGGGGGKGFLPPQKLPAFISLAHYSPLEVVRQRQTAAQHKKASQEKSGTIMMNLN